MDEIVAIPSPFRRTIAAFRRIIAALRRTTQALRILPAHFDAPYSHISSHHTYHILPRHIRTFRRTYPHIRRIVPRGTVAKRGSAVKRGLVAKLNTVCKTRGSVAKLGSVAKRALPTICSRTAYRG